MTLRHFKSLRALRSGQSMRVFWLPMPIVSMGAQGLIDAWLRLSLESHIRLELFGFGRLSRLIPLGEGSLQMSLDVHFLMPQVCRISSHLRSTGPVYMKIYRRAVSMHWLWPHFAFTMVKIPCSPKRRPDVVFLHRWIHVARPSTGVSRQTMSSHQRPCHLYSPFETSEDSGIAMVGCDPVRPSRPRFAAVQTVLVVVSLTHDARGPHVCRRLQTLHILDPSCFWAKF